MADLNYAKAKNNSIVGTSITNAYATLISAAEGHYIEVKNGTYKDLMLKTKNLKGDDVELILPATDYSMRRIGLIHSGDIYVKYVSAVPTTGTLSVQSICMGS